MRIDQLYYLVILSESSSIIEASEKLHLSHQVLGNFLKKTEEEFNVKIFKRSKKGIEITKNGQEIIEFAKETLEKYNKVCKKENNILKREIILYTTLIYTISVLPYIINYFPQMQIALYNYSSKKIIEKMAGSKKKNISVGFINFLESNKEEMLSLIDKGGLVYNKMFNSEMCYFVRKDSKFAKRKFLSEKEINSNPLALLRNFSQETEKTQNKKYSVVTDSFDVWLEQILREDSIGLIYDLALLECGALSKYIDSLSILHPKKPLVGSFGTIIAKDADEDIKRFADEISVVIKDIKS